MKQLIQLVFFFNFLCSQSLDLSLSSPTFRFIPATSDRVVWDDNIYYGLGLDGGIYIPSSENLFYRLNLAGSIQGSVWRKTNLATTEIAISAMRKINTQSFLGIGLSYLHYSELVLSSNPEYFQNSVIISYGYVFHSSFMFDVKADIFLRDNPLKEIVPVSFSIGYFFGDYFK